MAAAFDNHIGHIVGSLYRLDGMVSGLCTANWSTGRALFYGSNRKGTAPGAGGISVLSDSGSDGRMYSECAGMAESDSICVSIGDLQWYQFSGTDRSYDFSEKRYFPGIS